MRYPKSMSSNKFPDIIRLFPLFKNWKTEKAFKRIGLKNCDKAISTFLPYSKTNSLLLLNEYRALINTVDEKFFAHNTSKAELLNLSLQAVESNDCSGRLLDFCASWDHNNYMRALYLSDRIASASLPERTRICFSAEGMKGAWDIATMSMRGCVTCQSWNENMTGCLVGSIMDPFCGIMYLTNGNKTGSYGTEMLCRHIIRLVIYKNKLSLLIEPGYSYGDYDDDTTGYLHYFITFLREQTNNTLPVLFQTKSFKVISEKDCFIPKFKVFKKLNNCSYFKKFWSKIDSDNGSFEKYDYDYAPIDHDLISYSDSNLSYKKSPKLKELKGFIV